MPESTGLGELLAAAGPASKRLCVGIDPHPDTLNSWGVGDDAGGALEFAERIFESAHELGVSVFKPQVALFERFGVAGMSALASWIQSARNAGALVIADAKRGDIGTTMAGYADAWLAPGGDFESDGLTLSPFLGTGSLEPAFVAAHQHRKTVFVLAATSNPEGARLQSAHTDQGVSVAQSVLHELEERSAQSDVPATIGAVIGATVALAARGITPSSPWSLPVLAPGFGHQGAPLTDLARVFGDISSWVIPTVSRSVASDSNEGLTQRLVAHIEELDRVGV